MIPRVWNEGDPEPSDRPAVVDDDGVTWLWRELDDDEGIYRWTRMRITRYGGGLCAGFLTALDWWEVTGYGPLREATAGEADQVTVTYANLGAGAEDTRG